jgi:hypothetical protein
VKVRQAGVAVVTLSVSDKAMVATAMSEVGKEWADNLDKRGRSGSEVLDVFKAGLKSARLSRNKTPNCDILV